MTTIAKAFDLVGAGAVGNRIGRAFALMEIAEEELARAFPARVGEPPGIFRMLASSGAMSTLGDDVYRAHARELIDRARGGSPLKVLLPLTKAEMMMGFHLSSLDAPLNAVAFATFVRLFAELFPAKAAELAEVVEPVGWLAEEVDATLVALSRRVSPDREEALAVIAAKGPKPRRRRS